MAISLHPGDDEDSPLADINTTPLVDVMLVLLIIFMIAMPAALHAPSVSLPRESARPAPAEIPGVVITVERDGQPWWNDEALIDPGMLELRLRELAARTPQPAVQLRADSETRFAAVNRVAAACRRAGLGALDFATQPTREK